MHAKVLKFPVPTQISQKTWAEVVANELLLIEMSETLQSMAADLMRARKRYTALKREVQSERRRVLEKLAAGASIEGAGRVLAACFVWLFIDETLAALWIW